MGGVSSKSAKDSQAQNTEPRTGALPSVTPIPGSILNPTNANDDGFGRFSNIKPSAFFGESNFQEPQKLTITSHSTDERFLLGSLSAKIEQLQDLSRREGARANEALADIARKEKESAFAIKMLTSKYEEESRKVDFLAAELKRKEARYEADSDTKQQMINSLAEKVEMLTKNMETCVQKASEYGLSLNSAAKELQIESYRGLETGKTVQLHERAINNLSSVIETNKELVTKSLHTAAQELITRIELEGKSRRQLEESIRSDAQEFKRLIEKHINDKLLSIQAYTETVAHSERAELEMVNNALNGKLQRLEHATVEYQDQLAMMLNQRIENVESCFIEADKTTRKMEVRMKDAVSETLQLFESLVVKKDLENEKRYKDIAKKFALLQNTFLESLGLSEKAFNMKSKQLEEVLRAEIRARTEMQGKLEDLTEEFKSFQASGKSQYEKLQSSVSSVQLDIEKTLEKIQELAQKQEKMTVNFASELNRFQLLNKQKCTEIGSKSDKDKLELNEAIKEIGTGLKTGLNSIQIELDQMREKIGKEMLKVTGLEDKILKIDELETKLKAKDLQLDATLEAIKVELSLRPSETQINAKLEDFNESIQLNLEEIRVQFDDFKSESNAQEPVPDTLRLISELQGSFENKLSELQSQLVQLPNNDLEILENKIEDLFEAHRSMEELINQNAGDIHTIQSYKEILTDIQRKQNRLVETIAVVQKQAEVSKDSIKGISDEGEQLRKKIENDALELKNSLNTKLRNITNDIERLSEEVSRQGMLNEEGQQEMHESLKEINDQLLAQQETSSTMLSKKIIELENVYDEKLHEIQENSGRTFFSLESKINQIMLDLSNTNETLNGFNDEVKDVVNRTKKEKVSIEGALNELKISHKHLHAEYKGQKEELMGVVNKINSVERSLVKRITELQNHHSQEQLKFVNEYQKLSDTNARNGLLLDQQINTLKEELDEHKRELRLLSIGISRVSEKTSGLQENLRNANIQAHEDRNESESAILEHAVGPLNFKLDLLSEQLNSLETRLQINSNPANNTFGNSIYKPDFRPKTVFHKVSDPQLGTKNVITAYSETSVSKEKSLEFLMDTESVNERDGSSHGYTPDLESKVGERNDLDAIQTEKPYLESSRSQIEF
jgi:hypothetical protein